MGDSWRCARCDINYPDEGACLGCLDTLWWNKGMSHDANWRKDAAKAAAQREFQSTPYIPNVEATIIKWHDRLWIAELLLIDAGYLPDDFSIVRVNEGFYELMSRKADGDVPAWWIEEIDPDYAFESLPELSPYEYAELEKSRGIR